MKRLALIEMLENYASSETEEIAFKRDMINFIKANPDCFERFLETGHVVASAIVLNKDRSKVLLMHHAKLDLWVQLGGHCDGDPDVLAVAIREAQEESGIMSIRPVHDKIFDIDIHLIPENKKEKTHYHYDVRFLLQVVGDEQLVQNSESKELRWIDINADEVPTKERSVVRLFEKLRLSGQLPSLYPQDLFTNV